jgi:uncharacterized protein (DUF885 family)
MLQRIPKRLIVQLVSLAVATSVLPATAAQPKPAQAAQAAVAIKADPAFDKWSDKFAADWVRLWPERATLVQYFSGAEQDALDRQLSLNTKAERDKAMALARAGVAKLDQFLAGPLDATQRNSAETMRWSLANTLAGERFEDHTFVFNQMSGDHIMLVTFMAESHPLRRAADVSSYLARLEQLSTRLDESTARSRAAAAHSLIPPRFILEKAQGQVEAFLKPQPDQNVLVTALAQRTAKLSDLTPEARSAAIATATRIVAERIRPAYTRVQSFMAELYPRTGDAPGISRLPDGAAAYSQALASYTGTKLTAAEIHEIGLREVARIEAAMDGYLRQLGFTDGGIEARMRQLDKTLQPAVGTDPRPELLVRYTAMVRDAEQRSSALFNLKPRALIEVRREPPLTEGSAAAHYTLPAADGSRPGVFWVPMAGPEFEMARMRSLSYHEAVPGHHFQLAIQQELTGLPKFRTKRVFGGGSAHSEGWALYTERLAVEQGWYEGDVPGLLGALGSELFRARRLVVDTGLHTKGWTRQQAIDYGISVAETERYVVWPGQACAYMLGMLRIVELREKARAALGAGFSLPAFHDVVLRSGSVPMGVLTKIVDQWIAVQKAQRT